MEAVVIILLLAVVGGMVALSMFLGAVGVSRASGASEVAAHPDLRYPVPHGIDPAVVVDTLHREGYEATTAEDPHHQPLVHIRAATGTIDRERVRSTLRQVPYREGHDPAGVDEVQFTDE